MIETGRGSEQEKAEEEEEEEDIRREHACNQGVHDSHYRVLRIRWVVYALKNLLGVIRCAEMPESYVLY